MSPGQAWLNNDVSVFGEVLARQFLLVKNLAEFCATSTKFEGADDDQLDGVIEGCTVSLQRLFTGINYFGFPPGFVPRTNVQTISGRINDILPLAKTVQQQADTFLNKQSSQVNKSLF